MLAPCPTCRRHVDVAPGPCPFCDAPHASLRPRRSHAPGLSGLRPTRKAATLIASLALVGCSGSDETSTPTTDAVSDVATDTVSSDTVSSDTGLADSTPADTASTDTGTKPDATSDVADGGADATTDVADAADTIADTGFFPPYGHPPWDEALV